MRKGGQGISLPAHAAPEYRAQPVLPSAVWPAAMQKSKQKCGMPLHAPPMLRRALSDEMRDMLASAASISDGGSGGGGAAAPAITDGGGFAELLDLFSGKRTEWAPDAAAAQMTMEEAAEAQAEELEALTAIFGEDELQVSRESGCNLLRLTVRSLALQDAMGGDGGDPHLAGSTARLTVVMPASYPSAPAIIELDTTDPLGVRVTRAPLLSARAEEALYDELLCVAVRCAAVAEAAVFELASIARDALVDALADRERREAELRAARRATTADDKQLLSAAARAVFSLLQAETEQEQPVREDAAEAKAYRGVAPSADVVGTEEAARAEALVWERASEYYARTQHASCGGGGGGALARGAARNFHPRKYVGSVREVLESLPPGMCVLSVENVVRHDLAARFEERAARFKARKGSTAEQYTPLRTFHGTAAENVASIVSTGLVVPGKRGLSIVNGAAYGHGIYLAEDAHVSLSYCRGQGFSGQGGQTGRMLVCAALLGKNAPHGGWADAGNDSYRSSPILVLGSAPQCLPCYVIHFTYNHSGGNVNGGLQLTKGGAIMQTFGNKKPAAGGGAAAAGTGAGASKKESLSAAMQATIKNAAFYLDTKKFQVLGCAEHSDDDDDFEGIEFGTWDASDAVDEFGDVVGSGGGEYQHARRTYQDAEQMLSNC